MKMLRRPALYLRWISQKLFVRSDDISTGSPSSRVLTIEVKRHFVEHGTPPPLNWTPCHPSTIQRYKATMACPAGHTFTLNGHSVSEDGTLAPSVVCPVATCKFHAYVRLENWSFGSMR